MSNLGILGGTFDPPHLGHLILAQAAIDALNLSAVLFAPAGDPPHKDDYSSIDHRARMVELAIEDNPRLKLSRVDMDRPGPHYSVDTVKYLHQAYPNDSLYFLIGGDSLTNLLSWHNPVGIIAQARLGVMHRPDADIAAELPHLESQIPGLRDQISYVDAPMIGISATLLRDHVRVGHSIRYLVPANVEAYITAQKLYLK